MFTPLAGDFGIFHWYCENPEENPTIRTNFHPHPLIKSLSFLHFVNDFNQFKYIPDDGEAFDEFGVSVCIYENKVIVGSQHSNNSTGAVYLSNIKNCNNILACNYNNGLLNDDFGCEFPINNYDCSGSCFYEIDNCGVCNGQNLKGDVNSVSYTHLTLPTNREV